MLPENENGVKKTYPDRLERPLLPNFETMRIRYRKTGNLQYISHLDLQRTWMRVLTRAKIPMWYTQGFNPHPKLNYGCPLPVGKQSECEYLDVRIDRAIMPQEIKEQLNAELPDEMCVLDVYPAQTTFNDIVAACYTISIHISGATEAQAAAIDALLHGEPIMMTKKTKAGDKEINILSYVQEAGTTFRVQDGTILLHLVLAAGNTSNLNAEMLMTAIKEKTGLLREVNTTDCYEIMREEMLCADGSAFH